jgi:creatinine amidohydrolase/Fe(II)-dependent formamide hydrolase-like protein
VTVREYELLTAPALRELIERGVVTAIVPFGSIEHQGGHLPLGADALLADLVGREVAHRLDAVLVPTVRVGCAEQHLDQLGTLSVPAETLSEMALAIAADLAGQGFRRIVLVSIHGGNTGALESAVGRFNHMHSTARACAVRGDVGPDPGRHSGRWLTSVLLALRPELVDLPGATDDLRDELKAPPTSSALSARSSSAR